MLPLATYRASLARDARAVGEVAASHLDVPVPWCPGWTVADVALHLGGVHRWAADVVRTGQVQPEVDGRESGEEPLTWYAGGWPSLLAVLDAADPVAPCWGMGPPPRSAAFWWRRQAHETALHLWDVRTAAGLEAPFDDGLAADGLDEALAVFAPRQFRLGRTQPPSPAIAVDTGERRWVLGEGEPAATVSGEPLALLLLVWKRRALDDPGGLVVSGDRAALDRGLARPLVP